MAMAKALMALVALVVLLLLPLPTAAEDERVAELVQRQSGSSDGVIGLDDALVRQLVSSPNRPYSLLIFFDAHKLPERASLKIPQLRSEFGLVASSYIRNNAGQEGESKVFFCSLDFHQSQASFAAFGVQSLPHLRWVPAGSSSVSASQAAESDRSAEGIAAFVESRSKHKVGRIERPPLVPPRVAVSLLLGAIISAPLTLRWLIKSKTPLHSAKVWCIGALCVYFFSVSGGMHNIIRKMPLFMVDKRGAPVFFYHGSGAQLGIEGFAVASLYTVLGLALAGVTHGLPRLAASGVAQRVVMLAALALGFTAVTQVVSLDNWKTGYQVHAYLPNWRSWFS